VVTHNKGTMGACDRLYGITMETKGVSSWVSVQFQDVEKFVPEITSGVAADPEEAQPSAPLVTALADEPLPDYVIQPVAGAVAGSEVEPLAEAVPATQAESVEPEA